MSKILFCGIIFFGIGLVIFGNTTLIPVAGSGYVCICLPSKFGINVLLGLGICSIFGDLVRVSLLCWDLSR